MKSSLNAPLWVAIPVSIMTWAGAVFFTVLYVLMGFVCFLPVSALTDHGTREMIHWSAILWARSIIAITPVWKMKVDGLDKIDPATPYLIVCNHQSMLDILIVAAKLPLLFKFLAKKELFSIPVLGWHMSLAKYIPVDRSNKTSRHKALVDLSDWLKRGVSVLFFPEGTRSLDGEIHAFRPAAFKIARDAGVKILPVVVDGTGDALPKHSWLLQKRTVFRLSILPPVSMKNIPDEQIESIQEKIRTDMIERLRLLRYAA